MREYGGWVYILASKRNGTLYIGVTNDLLGRVVAHREGVGSHFTRKYGVTWLVWYEFHDRIERAIQRETSIKRWRRKWKLDLIEEKNPEWLDLFEELTRPQPLPDWARSASKSLGRADARRLGGRVALRLPGHDDGRRAAACGAFAAIATLVTVSGNARRNCWRTKRLRILKSSTKKPTFCAAWRRMSLTDARKCRNGLKALNATL